MSSSHSLRENPPLPESRLSHLEGGERERQGEREREGEERESEKRETGGERERGRRESRL